MKYGIIVVAILVLVGGGVLLLGGENEDSAESSNDATTAASESFTLAEVAEHATEDDCYTVVGDGVYDITDYIPRHPGGDEILLACGDNGTALFEERTTTEGETIGSGTPHSGSATSQLESFRIGDLSE